MKLSTKIFTGFALVSLFFVIDFFINQRLSQDVHRNTEFLTNSEHIIRNSTRLHKTIIDMQSGFRGYLLTGRETFLEPFYNGLKELPPLFNEQDSLLNNSTSQLVKLDSIQDLHNQWILYAQDLINKKRDTTALSNKEFDFLFESRLKKEVGKKINDQIANKFKEFDRYEYMVRAERRDILLESIENTRVTSLMLTILSLTIALAAAIYITRIISRRISSMVNLADTIAKGNFTVIEDNQNDELTNLSESLNIMSSTLNKNFTELEKKNRELDQFAYVVSHDLKAPLRGIDNISRWIREDLGRELSEGLKKYLDMMSVRIHRLESLINGLLEYARIGRVKKSLEEVDVKELINEISEVVLADGFTLTLKGEMPVITAEKIRLEQVFTNLISNAVKYHHDSKGHIEIAVEDSVDFYEFSVKDDGPGIEPEYHERIFQIFQTLRERDAVESTGVGLAIVKKIIEDQKGIINVISEPGKGSTFIFTWPKKPFTDD